MDNNYSIYYEDKIIATAWLTKGAESQIQLVTITPEGHPPDQPFTETILKPVSATLIDTIAIERAIHLYGLNPADFTISKKDTIEPLSFRQLDYRILRELASTYPTSLIVS